MDLTKMTLAQLKEVAKEKGMKGVRSTCKKQELMERIQETLSQGQEKAPATEKKPDKEKVQAAERMPEREKAPERGKACPGKGMSAAHGRLRPAATESTGTITVRKTEVNIAVMGTRKIPSGLITTVIITTARRNRDTMTVPMGWFPL